MRQNAPPGNGHESGRGHRPTARPNGEGRLCFERTNDGYWFSLTNWLRPERDPIGLLTSKEPGQESNVSCTIQIDGTEDASQDPRLVSPERRCAMSEEARPITLTGDRLLAFEALRLMMRLDGDIREARAQWNQDWFRRVMHARSKAVLRLRRRWENLERQPAIPGQSEETISR